MVGHDPSRIREPTVSYAETLNAAELFEIEASFQSNGSVRPLLGEVTPDESRRRNLPVICGKSSRF